MSDNAVDKLAEKVAALEKSVGVHRKSAPAPAEPSLAECNRRAREVMQEIKEEKQDAATLAKKAIDEAFRGGPRSRVDQKRIQKNLSPIGAETAASARVAKA